MTSIGICAFYECSSLTGVTIPSSVTKIGDFAFYQCASLANLTIENGLESIGSHAFYDCLSLTSVTIPESVTSIGSGAFFLCTSLKSVLIQNPSCFVSEVDFGGDSTLGVPGTTVIYGYAGSTAQTYADKWGFTFQSIEQASQPTPAPQLAAPTVKIAQTVDGIKVTWNKIDGAPRYMVYYKENNGGWKQIGTTTATTYTRKWSDLNNGAAYAFTVRCCASDKKTMLSGYQASNSLQCPAKLTTPTVKVALSAEGIDVSWSKVTGAAKYRVFYKTSASGSWVKIGDTTATSYTRKNAKLTSGKTYWFTVRCVSKNGKSYTSDYNTAGKSVKFIKAPTVKVALSGSDIKVSWDKIAGAAKYRVFYKTSANASWKKIGDTTSTSYTRKSSKLTNGTTYWFTVRCVSANGKSYVSAYNTTGKSVKYNRGPVKDLFASLPSNFRLFPGGAAAWYTDLTLKKDGSFTGEFYDPRGGGGMSEYSGGPGYDHTELWAKFSGKFTNATQINDYTYSVTLSSLKYDPPVGTEKIVTKDYNWRVREKYEEAPGLKDGKTFYIYTPDAPISKLPDDYLFWVTDNWSGRSTLSYYGLYNVQGKTGFCEKK